MQKMFDQVVAEESWRVAEDNQTKVLTSARDMVFYFSSARYPLSYPFAFLLPLLTYFIYYFMIFESNWRNCRQQCIELSTGRIYYDLFVLFQKFLALYAFKLKEKLKTYSI
jgi:hypothetical protein